MFAVKTELLLKEITRAEFAGKKVQVFKHVLDNRYGTDHIHCHSGGDHSAITIQNPLEILKHLNPDTDLVAIDEIQFFDDSIVGVIQLLLEIDVRVVFAGLSLDFRGEPFGSMPQLLALCDELDRPTAICTQETDGIKCGAEATRTQRLINNQPANYTDPIVLIGAQENYAARCPKHHIVPGKPQPKLPSSGNTQSK